MLLEHRVSQNGPKLVYVTLCDITLSPWNKRFVKTFVDFTQFLFVAKNKTSLYTSIESSTTKYDDVYDSSFLYPATRITKTHLYNFHPLKPHFYTVKLGFTGVYIIFLISAQKHRLWVLVRTASSRRF